MKPNSTPNEPPFLTTEKGGKVPCQNRRPESLRALKVSVGYLASSRCLRTLREDGYQQDVMIIHVIRTSTPNNYEQEKQQGDDKN